MKPEYVGLTIATVLLGYKACLYTNISYKLRKEKQKKIVDFQKVSELKEKIK